MKNISLANIGNRNLTYKGKTLLPDNRLLETQLSFRERTLDLLNQFHTIKPELNEQILSVLLNDIGPENIEKVVIFASNNQAEGDRNDQDTIHEAHILQQLFTERLGVIVDVVEYTKNVTHNDELLRFYREKLHPYQLSNFPIIICDAGGTAQQKAALKIAAEYLLDPAQFSVRYVLPSGKLTTVDQVEYRRIIDEEQVAALVQHGQYAGALAVYEALPNKDQQLQALIQFSHLRIRHLWADAQLQLSKPLKELSPLLNQFGVGLPSGNYDLFKSFFSKRDFFLICERVELACNSWRFGDYSGAVLNFQIFQELFLNCYISSFGKYNLTGNYFNAFEELKADLMTQASPIVDFFGGGLRTGVPLSIKYAQAITPAESPIANLLIWFDKSNSITSNTKKGTDALRNDIAHKGKGVNRTLLDKTFPTFDLMLSETRKSLRISEMDSFCEINRIIIALLRR